MAKATADKPRAAEGVGEDNHVREVARIAPSSDQYVEETLANNAPMRYEDDFMEGKQRMPDESTHLRAMSAEASIPVVSPIRPSDQSNFVQNAFDRMRQKRPLAETATITVGDKTVTTVIGSQRPNKVQIMEGDLASKRTKRSKTVSRTSPLAPRFAQKLRHFVAPGADVDNGHLSEEHSMSPDDAETRSDQSNEDSGFRTEDEVQPDEQDLKLERHVVEPDTRSEVANDGGTDGDYVDEAEKKAQEEARVAELIRAAEEGATYPSKDS